MSDVRTPELVINKLSKQQYENIQNPSDTEIYLVPEDEEHKPICYPTTASEVTTTSMVVKSSVSDNGKILTENGFVYNTSGNPTVSDTKVVCDLGAGFFEKKLENLTLNTEYHIKSYGQNSSGISYGSELVQRIRNNPIPVEYQLVEYLSTIGSVGNPFINTGVVDQQSIDFDAELLYDTNKFGFGVSSGVSTIESYWCSQNDTLSQFMFSGRYLNVTTYIGRKYRIRKQGVYGYVDDTQYNVGVGSKFTGLKWYLFNINMSTFLSGQGQIYHFVMSENNVIIRDFYPVYRIADNKPGMYDIVNNVFYTNQGTGEFVVGPDKEWDE